MDRREFYERVDGLLGVNRDYVEPLPYRRRWGRSRSGNGLYEGFGVVRWFSERMIQVVASDPPACRVLSSPEEALGFVEGLVDVRDVVPVGRSPEWGFQGPAGGPGEDDVRDDRGLPGDEVGAQGDAR